MILGANFEEETFYRNTVRDDNMKEHKEMLYEVIIFTIQLDNLIIEIFQTSFGLEPEYEEETDTPTNIKEIERFKYFFLQDMGATRKLTLLKELAKDLSKEVIFPKNFDNKFDRLYKIRNIFAHSLHPRHPYKKHIPKGKDIKWEDIYQEHKKLYNEIMEFLYKHFYSFEKFT